LTTDVLASIIEAHEERPGSPGLLLFSSRETDRMNSVITRSKLFGAKASRAETKADITDRTARGIIDAEAEKRRTKTARLRQARLEREARQVSEETAEPRRSKAAAPRRARSSM
jgi:hypothetical protein